MDIGIAGSWLMLIGGVFVGLYALSFVADGLFWCFAQCFGYVDGILQERHWRKIQGQITVNDIERLKKIFEEAA